MNELDLFVAAIAITDPAKRSAFLDEFADNPALRQRLDALLAGNEQSRHPLDNPPAHPQSAQKSPARGQSGTDRRLPRRMSRPARSSPATNW